MQIDRPGEDVDLQVIRPHPRVVAEGLPSTRPLFAGADRRNVQGWTLLIDDGGLVEQALDDHDVLKHYGNGTAQVQVFGRTVASIS